MDSYILKGKSPAARARLAALRADEVACISIVTEFELEFGLAKNENSLQGSYIIEELTELVEEAVLKEFDAIAGRGGVLGAMETGYQRGKIQEESLHYEQKKHDGSLPIVGVNTFRCR